MYPGNFFFCCELPFCFLRVPGLRETQGEHAGRHQENGGRSAAFWLHKYLNIVVVKVMFSVTGETGLHIMPHGR
ncbi:hypothetical protein BXC68_20635 [Salmonella enterica subsp. enterica serovar Enteritidis]|nr:hypothetical protein [Salmonella enterica subsp. enterica serovar Enteritidis]EDE1388501.1 hypothetical protein [Salmonella enterica subsp. enterica serovar Enteritidis]